MSLSASDLSAIRAAEKALAQAFESPDLTAWVDSYTDDAIFVGPGVPAIEGRSALLEAAPHISISSMEIKAHSTLGAGDLAATLGHATWVSGTKGSGATVRRRFLMVWRRDLDGAWRIAREMLNEDLDRDDPTKRSLGTPELSEFAERYTEAWCSGEPERVADHYSPDGSLTINGGAPAIGRAAITVAAQGFMDGFPDLRVEMDDLKTEGESPEYHWTLTGTNNGPGGTGRTVRVSGFEQWTIGDDGLIAASLGFYDEADWDRQIHGDPAF